MYGIVFMQGFVFYGPVATLFRQARGISLSQIFMIESVCLILMMVLEVPWGWIADRIGYKKTLCIANGLYFISKIVLFYAFSMPLFLLERILLAVVVSGLSGCDTALIYESIDESQAQKIFGRYMAMGTLGFLLASILSGIVISYSIDFAVFLTIFPYAVAFVMSLFLIDIPYHAEERVKLAHSIKKLFRNKNTIILVLATALLLEVYQIISVWLNQLQYVKTGINPKFFGLILAGVQVVRLISTKTDKITGKIGNNLVLIILSVLVVVSCIGLYLTTSPILSVLAVVLLAISTAILGPIEMDLANQSIESSDRATMLSLYSMLASIVAASSNIALGKFAGQSLSRGLIICILMASLGLILITIYALKTKNKNIKI